MPQSKTFYFRFFFVLIILVSIFFRFYNTPNRYGFDPDPTRDALLIYYGATTFHFPLVGAGSGIAPFTFGPWYYYQLILFRMIFPFAYTPWIYIGISSVLVSFFLYKIGELLINKHFGLLLAFLAAISPSETGQTQGLSNPNLVPFYSALVIFLFVFLMQKKPKLHWIFLWGIILSIGINIHYQMIGLLVLPVCYFFYKRQNIFYNVGVFLFGFLLPWIPLFLFNVLHNWHTLQGILYFSKHHPYTPNNWRIYIIDFWLPYWSYILGVNNIFGLLCVIVTLGGVVYLFLKKKLAPVYVMLLFCFFINFIFLRYVIAQRDYYYYLYLHSFVFIFFSLALWQLLQKKIGVIIVSCIILFLSSSMLQGDIERLQTRQDQLQMKEQAAVLMQEFPQKKISLYICNDTLKNNAQGVEFFLLDQIRLSNPNNAIKIGFFNIRCSDQNNLITKNRIVNLANVVNLSFFSTLRLQEQGWKLITPKSVYHDSVSWWTNTD